VFRDRLTPLACRVVNSRIVSPVIIKTAPRRLEEVVETIRPFTEELRELVPRLMAPAIQPLTPFPMKVIPRFNMIASLLPREVIFRLAENRNVERIFYDKPMWALQRFPVVSEKGVYEAPHRLVERIRFTTTFWTKKLLGCDEANAKGFTGRGVKVAICDSGASRVHEQIRRVRFATTMAQHRDENGHGSWVTSCIGGLHMIDEYLTQRTRTAWRVTCEGMAPECDLLAIKCLGFYVGMGTTSNIIDALDLAIRERADVVNMSLGGEAVEEAPEDDPYYEVFEECVRNNIILCVAAGNSGPGEGTVGTPGDLPQALTIGAYDPITGEIADFSSRGPTNWGDVKPDCVAPGVNVDSGTVGVCDKAGDGVPSRYSPISGTSMATPHVAGLVALARQLYRERLGRVLTVEEIKNMLIEIAGVKDNQVGWGQLTWWSFTRWLETEYGVIL